MVEEEIEWLNKYLDWIFEDKDVHSVILFGSYATGEATSRSDIDLCIVVPKLRGRKKEAFRKLLRIGSRLPDKIDLHVFELLPLYLKIQVIKKGKVLRTRNVFELYEYFRVYRKIWEDQKHRQSLRI